MQAILVDSNVVSFIFKDDTRGQLYEPHLEGKHACVAFMTVAELYRWAVAKKWGKRRIKELQQELSRYTVLPFDEATAWEWAKVRNVKGFPVDASDAWIAAVALRHSLPLLTHNPAHFAKIPGLGIVTEA